MPPDGIGRPMSINRRSSGVRNRCGEGTVETDLERAHLEWRAGRLAVCIVNIEALQDLRY